MPAQTGAPDARTLGGHEPARCGRTARTATASDKERPEPELLEFTPTETPPTETGGVLGSGSAGSGTVTVVPLEPLPEGLVVVVVVDVDVVVVDLPVEADDDTEPDGAVTGGSEARGRPTRRRERARRRARAHRLRRGSRSGPGRGPAVEPGRLPAPPDSDRAQRLRASCPTNRATPARPSRSRTEERAESELLEHRGREPCGRKRPDGQQRAQVRQRAGHVGRRRR